MVITMTKTKKKLLIFFILMWLVKKISYDYNFSSNYEIVMEDSYFARYSKGRVYIGNREYINSLNDIDENDILIIDNRNSKDPDMKILSSYRIMDYRLRDEILNIITEYERRYPSSWNRSVSSMKVEWIVHNILYYLNYKTYRTRDVDFNNEDEKIYRKKF